jgi:hypothetical protein
MKRFGVVTAEAASNPPQSPFSRGKFRSNTLTPPFDELRAGFGKEGEGDFWVE